MSPKEQLIEAFRHLCETQGGVSAIADEIDASEEGLKQVLAGTKLPSGEPRGIGPKIQRKLETRYPGWSTRAAMTPSSVGIGTPIVLDKHTVLPEEVGWEALMGLDELPEEFVVAVPDDAMAPAAPRGTRLSFRRGVDAEPGDGVLVQDGAGRRYVRRFAQGRGDAWIAQATNAAYATLDSVEDELTLLAVMTSRIVMGSKLQ